MTIRHPGTSTPVQVQVTTRGHVSQRARDYAAGKVGAVAEVARTPVTAASVVLAVAHDPARARPVTAEGTLVVDGTQIRAKTAGTQPYEAVDLLVDRLRRNLVQHADRVRTRHRWIGIPDEHLWRHGDLPTPRPDAFPRPAEERQVVRRKTFALAPITVDEAAYEMDLLGHDFYLFVEVVSGADALVYRDGEEVVVVGDVVRQPQPQARIRYDGAAPTLTEAQARDRLEAGREPFVFYRDAESMRGRVLYLRYDGHYGLIVPAV